MKKFSKLIKEDSIDFQKGEQVNISNDVNDLDSQIISGLDELKLDGSWEIESIIDVSMQEPTNEAIIINAELGNTQVKRGDFLYITAQLRKPGDTAFHQSKMGCIKVRVVEIYNTLMILNSLK
jgi:hypothetical protein